MKHTFLFPLLLCASFFSHAQSNYEIVNCESRALRLWTEDQQSCLSMPNGNRIGGGLKAVAECNERAAKSYVRNSCIPSLRMVANNDSILWQQLKIINQQYMLNQISYDRAGSQSVMLMKILKEQQSDYENMVQSEVRIMRADEAEKQSRRFVSMALNSLEIVSKNGKPLTPTNMTYILNGKMYNCNTVGNITDCR
jgi:hypothetical protein